MSQDLQVLLQKLDIVTLEELMEILEKVMVLIEEVEKAYKAS